jgi:hypothetical protein
MAKKKFKGSSIFKDRTVIIATMHGKEKVIAPILERELGVRCHTDSGLNTDVFGTFTGEIERKDTPMATVRAKALAALAQTDETLVVASEGSFGPHPENFFIPGNEEIVILIDANNEIEVAGKFLTQKTNYNHSEIQSLADLEAFLNKIGYPEHRVIIRAQDADNQIKILKNFKSYRVLKSRVRKLMAMGIVVQVETDMRAMNNPTRMIAIEQAVIDLLKNLKSLCPECHTPGFTISEGISGLPCSFCGCPTKSTKAYLYGCKKCLHTCKRPKANVAFEDPMYCMYCNYCNP